MTRTGHKATNLSNDLPGLSADSYKRASLVCKHCEIVADTAEKARAICPVTNKRHFLISR